MKKQILILSLFILASLASISTALGQIYLQPRAFTCNLEEGPLNPALGKTYTYSVTVPTSAVFTGGLTYQYFVTKDPNIIVSGDFTTNRTDALVGTDYVVHEGTVESATAESDIEISWNTSATAAAPYFLVVNVVGDNGVCEPHNTKVYKIEPRNLFTIDVANIQQDRATLTDYDDVDYEFCVSPIETATWVAGTETMNYDYGADTLYFAVAAANFSTSYTATVNITNDQGQTLITEVAWAPSTAALTHTTTFTAMTNVDADTWSAVIPARASTGTVDAIGETSIIRVIVDYTNATTFFEGLVDQLFKFEIDAETALGDPDLSYADVVATSSTCGEEDGFANDKTEQTIKQRPTVITNTEPGEDPTDQDPYLTPVNPN